jgi:hypothetical protein
MRILSYSRAAVVGAFALLSMTTTDAGAYQCVGTGSFLGCTDCISSGGRYRCGNVYRSAYCRCQVHFGGEGCIAYDDCKYCATRKHCPYDVLNGPAWPSPGVAAASPVRVALVANSSRSNASCTARMAKGQAKS